MPEDLAPVTEPAPETALATATAPVEPAAEPVTEPEYPDWARNPADATRMVREAREQAAQERVKARDTAKAEARTALLQELGLADANETPDPVALAAQIAAKDTTIRELTIRNALTEAITEAHGKPLTRAAITGDGILNDLDPTADDFQATLNQRVNDYITRNPELRASQAAAVGSADISGGAGTIRTYTRSQIADPVFYQANKTDILAALQQGRINP